MNATEKTNKNVLNSRSKLNLNQSNHHLNEFMTSVENEYESENFLQQELDFDSDPEYDTSSSESDCEERQVESSERSE